MFTKKTAIKKIRKFLKACKKLPFSIDKAILFGSIVQNKSNEYSDIDLALISKNFDNNILNNIDLIGPVNIHFPEIDLHTFSPENFKQKGILTEQIKKYGIEIS